MQSHDHEHHGHDHDHGNEHKDDHGQGHGYGHRHRHDHGHGQGGHSHAPADFGRAFAIGASVNAGFVVLQIVYGLSAHSVALLADAAHNAGDVLGLLIAWGASVLATRQPSDRRTYGWGRTTILAALANAVVLLIGCGAIGVEALRRFGEPGTTDGVTVTWVALAGIVVNGGTALLFMRGRAGDLNVRAAFLHLAGDAAVSLGVVVSGVLIALTGRQWIDPVTSLAIVGLIGWSTWGVLRQSVDLALDTVPAGIDCGAVRTALGGLPGVTEVHDLHIWPLSTTRAALTAHLVTDLLPDRADSVLTTACKMLQDRFGLDHTTLQIETAAVAARCTLRPNEVV